MILKTTENLTVFFDSMIGQAYNRKQDVNDIHYRELLVLHSGSWHNRIENHREKLFLVSLGGSQHHESVLDRRAVQMVQRHVLRSGQGLWVNRG